MELTKACFQREMVNFEDRFTGSSVHLAAFSMTACSAFLCDKELARLCSCEVSFCDAFVRIYLLKSKTDVYRVGAHVLVTKTDSVSCHTQQIAFLPLI